MIRRNFLKGVGAIAVLSTTSLLACEDSDEELYAIIWNKDENHKYALLFMYNEERWMKIRRLFPKSLERNILWGETVFLRKWDGVFTEEKDKLNLIEHYYESNPGERKVKFSDIRLIYKDN